MKTKKFLKWLPMLALAAIMAAGCGDSGPEDILTPEQELKNKLLGEWESTIRFRYYNPPQNYKISDSTILHASFTDDSVEIVTEVRIRYSDGRMTCNFTTAFAYEYKILGKNLARTKRCWNPGVTPAADSVIHEVNFLSSDTVELSNFYDLGGICTYGDMKLHRKKEKNNYEK